MIEAQSQAGGMGALSTKLAILAMAVGSFGIGTGEFAIMGLLPNLARDMAISEPEAGHVISAYALGVVVGAPLIAIAVCPGGAQAAADLADGAVRGGQFR